MKAVPRATTVSATTVSSSLGVELVYCKGTTEVNISFTRRSVFVDAIWPDGDLLTLSCSARYPYPREICMHGVVGGCLLLSVEQRSGLLWVLDSLNL